MRKIINAKGLIDGTGAPVRDDVAVLIEDGKIAGIEASGSIPARPDDVVIDLPDDYLLPGFIDSHSHGPIRPGDGDQVGQFMDPPAIAALRSAHNLRRSLKSGVTTMRMMHAEKDLDVHLREAISESDQDTIFSAKTT